MKMLIYEDFSKKSHIVPIFYFLFIYFVFLPFWKFLIYLVCFPSLKSSVNSSSLSRKKYDGGNFIPAFCQRLQIQNTSLGIGLIELSEHSDTLNYKPFFKNCILQTVLHIFLLFMFVWNKTFCSKNWAVFYIFLIWFVVAFGVTLLKVLCFWCSF